MEDCELETETTSDQTRLEHHVVQTQQQIESSEAPRAEPELKKSTRTKKSAISNDYVYLQEFE